MKQQFDRGLLSNLLLIALGVVSLTYPLPAMAVAQNLPSPPALTELEPAVAERLPDLVRARTLLSGKRDYLKQKIVEHNKLCRPGTTDASMQKACRDMQAALIAEIKNHITDTKAFNEKYDASLNALCLDMRKHPEKYRGAFENWLARMKAKTAKYRQKFEVRTPACAIAVRG